MSQYTKNGEGKFYIETDTSAKCRDAKGVEKECRSTTYKSGVRLPVYAMRSLTVLLFVGTVTMT